MTLGAALKALFLSSYQSAQEMRQERGIPVVTCSGSCKAALSPWLTGAAGHACWYVSHLVLWTPPTLGLTVSAKPERCSSRKYLGHSGGLTGRRKEKQMWS